MMTDHTKPLPPTRGSNRIRKPSIIRTPNSCDRCRSRKTKCIDPVPGPCRYCLRIGATCGVAARRKQRPFYHVTEEEYRCSMQILKHFLPSQELNLQTLRSIAKDIDTGVFDMGQPRSSQNQLPLAASGPALVEEVSGQDAEPESEEINDLHDQLGCLMQDSLGRFRYIGACSEIPFNAAVCSMTSSSDHERHNSTIITPPKVGRFPPELPKTFTSPGNSNSVEVPYLPPRDYCNYYTTRFFQEVHCNHWFYFAEDFHTRLDDTYNSRGVTSSNSWICSLYSIFAIGATSSNDFDNEFFDDIVPVNARSSPDTKTSLDYFSFAKELVPRIYDEADIDSIRALAILSLASENLGFRITSYLYVGASIQIAYSLGLHHDKISISHNPVMRQQNRRIWWTLFMLDQEIAFRCGSPCLINERVLNVETPLPSEVVMNPGVNTPLDWLSVSASLCRLKRNIIHTIYPERTSTSKPISFSKVSCFISSLQQWQVTIPSHLSWGVPVAATQRRSISILHLNYWGTMILLTRPFLLYLVLRSGNLSQPKRKWFERLAEMCTDAARNSITIFKAMAVEKTLSSLTTFDCSCILRVIMILILSFAHTKLQHLRSDIELCLETLRGMEQVGFCKLVTQETPIRIADVGIIGPPSNNTVVEGFNDSFTTQLWPGVDIFGSNNIMTPFQSLETLETAFGDTFPFDMDVDPFAIGFIQGVSPAAHV